MTVGIAAALVLVFGLRAILAAGLDPYGLLQLDLRLGALAPPLAGAEPWRVVSGALLHRSPGHLVAELVGLVAAGARLESLRGGGWTLTVFVVGIIGAGCVVAGVGGGLDPTGGAAPGSAALLGASLALSRAWPPAWLGFGALPLALPWVFPFVDPVAPWVGLGVGAALGLGLRLRPVTEDGVAAVDRGTRGAVVAVVTLALAGAIAHVFEDRIARRAEVERVLLGARGEALRPGHLERWSRVLGAPPAPDWLVTAVDDRLLAAASESDASPDVLLVWAERLEARQAHGASLKARWRAWQAHGVGAFPALVEGLAAWTGEPPAFGMGRAPPADFRWSAVSERMALTVRAPLERAASALFEVSDRAGAIRAVLEWPIDQGPASEEETPVPPRLLDLLEGGATVRLVAWTAPPRVDRPRLHPYRAGVRWRRL